MGKQTDKDEGNDKTNNSQTQQSTNRTNHSGPSIRGSSTSSDGSTNTIIACRGNIAEGAEAADRCGGSDLHVGGFSGCIRVESGYLLKGWLLKIPEVNKILLFVKIFVLHPST